MTAVVDVIIEILFILIMWAALVLMFVLFFQGARRGNRDATHSDSEDDR